MSAEQTSQTYLTPPSPPLAAVFFLMTPMVAPLGGHTMHTRAGIRIIRGERGDAALIEPEPPSGQRRRERSVQRASVNGGRGRHSGATRSLMDLRDGGCQLDGIVVARCWLEGKSQQLSSKWLARHGLFQVARVPASPEFIRQTGLWLNHPTPQMRHCRPWVRVSVKSSSLRVPTKSPQTQPTVGTTAQAVASSLSHPSRIPCQFTKPAALSGECAVMLTALLAKRSSHSQLQAFVKAAMRQRSTNSCLLGAFCGGPFITRPVYPDVQTRRVQCRTHTAAPVPPFPLCPLSSGQPL